MSHPAGENVAALVAQGAEAMQRGAWPEARAAFEAALQHGENPEVLEALATATWWLEDRLDHRST